MMTAAAMATSAKSTNQNRGAAPPSEIMEAPESETTYGEINGMSTTTSTEIGAKAKRTQQRALFSGYVNAQVLKNKYAYTQNGL